MSSQNPCLPSSKQAAMDFGSGSTSDPCVAIRCRVTYSLPPSGRVGEGVNPLPLLLDLGAGARVLELLQDTFRLFAVDPLLDRLGSLVHQVLRFLEAQPRDLTDDLDHADLGIARRGQHHLELGLP